MDDGITEEQAIKTVDSYSPKDWQQELEGARLIIVNTIKRHLKTNGNNRKKGKK